MANITELHRVVEAFYKAIDQASFVLKENPEQVFSQLYNRLNWQADRDELLKKRLDFERKRFKKPWFLLLTRPAQSSALIRTLVTGHTPGVKACAFSPDGSRIVSAGGYPDKTLMLWEGETGEEITTLKGHTWWVTACAFSPDGSRIVSASVDSTLKLWDAETGEEITTLEGHTNSVTDCAFSSDGSRIVSASWDKTLKLWEAKSGEEITTLKGHTDVVSFCVFSPDGSRIVLGDGLGQVIIVTIENVEIFPAVVTPYIQSGELSFLCPYCQEKNQIEESSLGQEVRCSYCGKTVKLNPFTVKLD